MEKWRDIKDYPDYQVSNMGRVKSLKFGKEKILKNIKNNYGYLIVNLSKEGEIKVFKVHRLVASAFIDNPNNLPEVNHINEDKTDNRVNNLEWCSSEYNINFGTRNKRVAKRILQFTLEGEFVRKWDSLKEFGKPHSAISNCLSGRRKSAYGYIWRYYDEILYLESLLLDRFNIKNKRVA